MESFKKWGVLIIVISGFVVLSSFVLSKWLNSNLKPISNTSVPTQQRVFPKEVAVEVTSDFKILYQDPNDKKGRTLLYESSNRTNLNGVGKYELSAGQPYYIGIFQGFQQISNSKDKLFKLTDPLQHTDIGVFRAIFVDSPLFKNKAKTTVLSVENISRVMSSSSTYNEGVIDWAFITQFKDLTDVRIASLMQKGDAIVIFPLTKVVEDKREVVFDSDNHEIISQIFIRRINGAKDLSG